MNTTIQQDEHGMYVVFDNYVFRPVETTFCAVVNPFNTSVFVGEDIDVQFLTQTCNATIICNERELWYNHGSIPDEKFPTKFCWNPHPYKKVCAVEILKRDPATDTTVVDFTYLLPRVPYIENHMIKDAQHLTRYVKSLTIDPIDKQCLEARIWYIFNLWNPRDLYKIGFIDQKFARKKPGGKGR